MIRYVAGDIFDSKAQALVNPVNCVGVMGAGLAKQFKERFPNYYIAYQNACAEKVIRLGYVDLSVVYNAVPKPHIISFPTKHHWRDKSQIGPIADGLVDLAGRLSAFGWQSVAIPMLGCGLGGLDWADVQPLIEQAFADHPEIYVEVYGPSPERWLGRWT